jgi:acetyl/propionyl-CoA carboxylase alpha subunit
MITGFDLVKEQIKVVLSGELSIHQDDVEINGTAIEARVLAEDPDTDFTPTTGEVLYLKEPGGTGIRVDSSLYQGMEISVNYDSLLTKLIAWGQNREEALSRLRRALREYQIGGLKTNLAFLSRVIDTSPYRAGNIDTSFLDEVKLSQNGYDETLTRNVALAIALHAHRRKRGSPKKSNQKHNPWRKQAWQEQMT